MAALRHFSKKILNSARRNNKLQINNTCAVCVRLLNYSSKEYDGSNNPAPLFFNKEIQSLLKSLTRVDLAKVFKKKRLGGRVEDPEYQFMTDEQLRQAMDEAQTKANEMLQMPPVLPVRKPITRIISKDPALEGLTDCRLIFTDITFGVKDSERLVVVREPNGDLKEAEWELRERINQIYFPRSGKSIKIPKLFEERYLEDLLKRNEYEFILNAACAQFEPDDPEYQRVVTLTYQYINDNNGFDLLRSTRHFGPFAFFLVWEKNIDNLLLDLIETSNIHEVNCLLEVYSKVHNIAIKNDDPLMALEQYIKTHSNKKGALELAVQAYKEVQKQRQEVDKGIKIAHGIS